MPVYEKLAFCDFERSKTISPVYKKKLQNEKKRKSLNKRPLTRERPKRAQKYRFILRFLVSFHIHTYNIPKFEQNEHKNTYSCLIH